MDSIKDYSKGIALVNIKGNDLYEFEHQDNHDSTEIRKRQPVIPYRIVEGQDQRNE